MVTFSKPWYLPMESLSWGPWGYQNLIKMAFVFWYCFLITFFSILALKSVSKWNPKSRLLTPWALQIPHVSPQCPPDPHFAQKWVPKTPPREPPDPQTPYHPAPQTPKKGAGGRGVSLQDPPRCFELCSAPARRVERTLRHYASFSLKLPFPKSPQFFSRLLQGLL